MQKDKYYRPYRNGKYIHREKGDIGKSSIPKKDRCEGFDNLWNTTFMEVMKYWDVVPVTDIHEFDRYEHVVEED